jgi:hypothetical protein
MFDGFVNFRYYHLWENARERLSEWAKGDKLQVYEEIEHRTYQFS